MQVTLKHVGYRQAGRSALDPFDDTLEILWEVEGDFPWEDPDGKHSKVVHTIKPVVLEKDYSPRYIRIQ